MRVMVLFDLPMKTTAERRSYSHFRKYLLKQGFIMLQQSVYTKIVLSLTAAKVIMEKIRENKPAKGLVQMITITEKQYARMESVVGEYQTATIETTDRLVIL